MSTPTICRECHKAICKCEATTLHSTRLELDNIKWNLRGPGEIIFFTPLPHLDFQMFWTQIALAAIVQVGYQRSIKLALFGSLNYSA